MKTRLSEPWFDAKFIGEIEENGSYRYLDSIDGAQGVFLWCPCGRRDPKYQDPDGGRPHGLLLPFHNPRNAPLAPDSFNRQANGKTPRWVMTGTGITDLCLTPSISIGKPQCWHGFVTNGEVKP